MKKNRYRLWMRSAKNTRRQHSSAAKKTVARALLRASLMYLGSSTDFVTIACPRIGLPMALYFRGASRTVAGGQFVDALERSVNQRKHGIQIENRLKRRTKTGSVLHKLRWHEQSRNHRNK